MKWLRWLWFLMAVGSFAVAAFLAVNEQMALIIIVLATIFWFFIAIAIGGKEALPFGVGILVFVGCLVGVYYVPQLLGSSYKWSEAKKMLDGLIDKPGEITLIYLGLISLIVLLIMTPSILVARGVGKLVSRKVAAQPASAARQPQKKKGLPDVGQP